MRKNTKVLVPIYVKDDNCGELTIEYLKKFGIEDILANHPITPAFYVYYCTQGGDILGKLMLTDNEMIFEPLNHKLKGFHNYNHGDFRKNTKMGFVVGFRDIVTAPEALVTRSKTSLAGIDVAKMTNENYYLRIDICDTGYRCFAKDEIAIQEYEKFSKFMRPLASFAIKINNKSLVGEVLLNGKKHERVMRLRDLLMQGWNKKNDENLSFTNVPCFDLHFYNILNEHVE